MVMWHWSNKLETRGDRVVERHVKNMLYSIILEEEECYYISANTNGPCDAASCKINMLSEITRQQTLQATFKAHCYTDHHLAVISTHILDKAQTLQFVVNVLYKQVYLHKKIKRMELEP